MLESDIVNSVIKVMPDWTTVVWQLVNTLILIGLIVLIFYIVFKLPKTLKRILVIENKVVKGQILLQKPRRGEIEKVNLGNGEIYRDM
ncbi:hypothetical protein [Caloranaerobacter sp. DY30410]|uniref:hypothetical protein n=1 Tax=Caloranaerobacter sp. DY30410 TaxID=3238305 RepID=UPI003D026B37